MRSFPREAVDASKRAVRLSDLAARYTDLRPAGGGALLGLCPLHEERTPSFRVDDERGQFKCFGCGKAGDHLDLLQERERLSFPEAVRELARVGGVDLPHDDGGPGVVAPDGPAERRRRALAFAGRFYHGQLAQSQAGAPARVYLRRRGFAPPVLRRFGVGYAPRQGEARAARLAASPTPLAAAAALEGVALEDLVAAGLVRESRRAGGGYYEVFRGRIVFPVLDPVRGHVLGFAGRRLDRAGSAQDDRCPKYVNTSEECGYDKREALFGLHQARRSAFGSGQAVLVEGYADVLALHQAGVTSAVAAGGTAFTAEQAAALRRLGERVLVVYDADAGGLAGAVDAVRTALAAGLRARVATLPEGEDPASYLAAAAEVADAQTALEARATDAVTYVYEAVRAGRETVEGHLDAVRAVVRAIEGVVDPLTREAYLQRTAEVSGMRPGAVEAALGWGAAAEPALVPAPVPAPVPA
ncbi:DNA primase [Rubrivirga sp. S365]|uniref:DNA primase n=1 Tax=Rubrivirga sp. S365 TaxID=3076080 RepID=UPI0028C529F2|nr:DNA primase [Rubrivirga sp. S365]MDT7858226.1 DNA primase [Rubrivirga sp. S365]